jgi:hypothetical protein
VCLHNDTNGFKAPKGTGKLKSLQTLGVVAVAMRKENALKELTSLTQLRKLCVAGIKKENREKFWFAIAAHNRLCSLKVYQAFSSRTDGDGLDGCLGGDLLPPKHLESLKLDGFLVRVPHWMHHLWNLSKLDLKFSGLGKHDEIQTLGALPNLAVLRLRVGSLVMNQLHLLGSSFPSLVVLELSGLSQLNLIFEKDALAKLELLETDRYREMEGLQFLKNLKEIRLND